VTSNSFNHDQKTTQAKITRFCSSLLGAYRAFVTDQHQTVVLHYSGRTVVVSPSSPEEFVHDIGIPSHAA